MNADGTPRACRSVLTAGPVASPYFSLERRAWFPRVLTWDPETGFFESVEGPEGFREYGRALEASRLLRALIRKPRQAPQASRHRASRGDIRMGHGKITGT